MALVIRAGVALLTVLVASGCATNSGSVTSKPGTTYGKIYVDTPEVYSRERLVNDRFQQDAWLREKLREKPTHGLQGSTGTSSRTSTALALGVGVKPQAPPKEQAEKPGKPKEVEDTPIEQFRDTLAYREEVRNEILENQLDDRHDIEGNTLYRLKFDATIIPNHDTSAYAMVEVTIAGPAAPNISEDDAKRHAPGDRPEERSNIPLPDWEFASYVPGLDERTITLYTRAYEGWVKATDSKTYSEDLDEITFGPLQKYFAISGNKDGFAIIEKEHCQYYGDEAKQDEALRELIARGVPREYLKAGTYYEERTDGEILEITTYLNLCVQTGLANFISDLRSHETVTYTYAVTPKERVQRIAGETLTAGALGVSVGAEHNGIGASLGHSTARAAQANAIMRKPQVVGYSPKAHRPGEAIMGWLIGPRYRISSDPKNIVSFRHVPTQHTLTGIVSVPSWWNELKLVTKTYWRDENGVEFTQEGKQMRPEMGAEASYWETTIALPADLASIVDIFDPQRREPELTEPVEPNKLRACEEGALIIRGNQLWRGTVVILGGQQADKISVLPNMKGVIATFDLIQPSSTQPGQKDLYLWTSEGEVYAGAISILGECKK